MRLSPVWSMYVNNRTQFDLVSEINFEGNMKRLQKYYKNGKTRFYAVFIHVPGKSLHLDYVETIVQRGILTEPDVRDDRVVVGFATRRQRDRGVYDILTNWHKLPDPKKLSGIKTVQLAKIATYARKTSAVTIDRIWTIEFKEVYGGPISRFLNDWTASVIGVNPFLQGVS